MRGSMTCIRKFLSLSSGTEEGVGKANVMKGA